MKTAIKILVSITPLMHPIRVRGKEVTHRAMAQKEDPRSLYYASGDSHTDALTELFYLINNDLKKDM